MKIILLLFFFLSGACGLVYEVVWIKLFALSMGSTTYALSTVIAAFMGGLALGSRYGGKWIDRGGNPLLVYGILEGTIGLYCLVTPWLVTFIPSVLGPLYDNYYTENLFLFGLLRFVLSALILLIPTILMGASLPILAKYFAGEKKRFGWEVGRLYAVNTFGAGVGAFCAGFFLLPLLGKRLAIYSAAATNIGICAAVLLLWFFVSRRRPAEVNKDIPEESSADLEPNTEPELKWGKSVLWAILAIYAINGFAGMAYQVAWTRALTLSIGSSTYSFTIIVTMFIFGLALGSGIGARLTDRLRNPAAAMGWVEILIGFSALVVMWGLGRLPKWMLPPLKYFWEDWEKIMASEFVIVGALLLFPTLLMGALFPLAMKAVGMCRSGVGEPVGLAYGLNTVGAILGSLAAGFLMIPTIGLQHTIAVANIMNWAAGAAVLIVVLPRNTPMRWGKALAPLIVGIIVTVIIPKWDTVIMSSGPFVYGKAVNQISSEIDENDIIFHKEGVDTTVTVIKASEELLYLRVNGKTDASTVHDMATQKLVAHIPMIMHSNPKKVCLVGLASGITLGSVIAYDVDNVDVLEISAAVVEASEEFIKWNNNSAHDPRVKVIVGDGRNHFMMTRKKYDVVISQPSNPWIAGISTLFTREYFKSVKASLNPGGIFCCWLQGYTMPSDEIRMIMRTFQSVFPYANLWEGGMNNYFMIGSLNPLSVDPVVLKDKIQNKKIASAMVDADFTSAAEFFRFFLMGSQYFIMASGEGESHIDDLLQLEYRAPRFLYTRQNYYSDLFKKVIRYQEDPRVIIKTGPEKWPEGFAKNLDNEVLARNAAHIGMVLQSENNMNEAFKMFEKAVRLSPHCKEYQLLIRILSNTVGLNLVQTNKPEQALIIFTRAIAIVPDNGALRGQLASVYMLLGRVEEAETQFKKAVKLNPKDHVALYNLGYILATKKDNEGAAELFKRVIEINPKYAPAYNALGNIAGQGQRLREAEEYFLKSIELRPEFADGYANLGKILAQHKDTKKKKEGLRHLNKALKLDPKLKDNKNFMGTLKTLEQLLK